MAMLTPFRQKFNAFFKEYLYYSFRRGYRLREWFIRRTRVAGQLLLAGVLGAALFGFNTNANLAYQIFSFLFILTVLALVSRRFIQTDMRAERFLPRYGAVNQPLSYRVRLHNQRATTETGLTLLEDPGDPLPTVDQYLHTPLVLPDTPDWLSRRTGFQRWQHLVARSERVHVEPQSLPAIGPNQSLDVRVTLTPKRRGRLEFSRLIIQKPDIFGFFNKLFSIPRTQSLLILPKLYPLKPIVLPGSRKYQPGGVALASSVGDSEEFVALREYRPGDPLKRIHWRSWARLNEPVVKEFQEEFFVRYALILDTFCQDADDVVFEEAVSIAASIVHTMHDSDSLLDLMFVGPRAYCFTSGRGLSDTDRMLEVLASVQICADQSFESLYPLVAERAAQLSACVCVFIDWDEPRHQLVRLLKNLSLPIKVLLITRPDAPTPWQNDATAALVDEFIPLEAGRIEEGLDQL